jgi:hypothetical protein
VLLDPLEAKNGGADFTLNKRMLIYAASNNEKHFQNGILKTNPTAKRYLSPWSEEELRVGLPRMQQGINVELALSRAKEVGPLPRYLLNEGSYKKRNNLLNEAVEKLSENSSELKEALLCRGTDKFGYSMPGTILAVYSGAQEPHDEEQNVKLPEYVYDGPLGVVYTTQILGIMSHRVVKEIVMKSRSNILLFWSVIGSCMGSSMGQIAEDLFWTDLANTAKGTLKMKQWELTSDKGIGKQGKFLLKTPLEHHDNQKFDEIMPVFERNNTIARMTKICPLIDFAGPGRKVYQVSARGMHDFSSVYMIDLLIQLEFLKKHSNGSLQLNATPQDPLEFYWVIPYSSKSDWKEKLPKTVQAGNPDKQMIKDCLNENVHQYVLVMEAADPFVPDM